MELQHNKHFAGALFAHLSYVTFEFVCFAITHWIVETAQANSEKKIEIWVICF